MAGGKEELLQPITVVAGLFSHLSCRTVTVSPGATCFKNQPHKEAKNQWKGHQIEVCGYSLPSSPRAPQSMVGGSLRPYHSDWL